MALRVWLPLNGNIENKGLSDACKGEGTLTYGDGKIGKALYMETASTANGIYAPKQERQVYTVALWFKAPGYTGTRRDLCNEGRDYNTYGWRVGLKANENTFDIVAASSGGSYSQSFTPDTWYHIAFSRDKNKNVYIYINGALVSTKTGTGDLNYSESNGYINIGRFCHGSGNSKLYPYQGYLNDFRYYDECLSQKQIKEISKGLVAHYKLTGIGANKNYIKNSDWSNKTNGGIYTFNGDEVIFHSDIFEASGHSFAQTMDSAGVTDFKNKILTFSMEYQITEPLVFGTKNPWVGFELSVSRNTTTGGSSQWLDWYGGKSIPTAVTDGWVYYKCSVTVTDYDIASIGINFYMRDTTGTIKYRHPKVEVGNVATPWIPNEADALYSKLGYANDICTDVSGNGYNLIQNGVVTFNTDTIRYSGSSLFDGDTSCFEIPFNTLCPENIFTINIWFKKDSVGTKNYETLIGGPSGFEMDTRNNGASTLSLYMASTRGGSAGNLTMGEWNMVTMVRDGLNEYYYINGQLSKTIEAKAMPTGTYYIGAWQTATKQNYYGLMSDFRIYATALSADDILTMYKNSGIIDNKGNVYAYEFKEE